MWTWHIEHTNGWIEMEDHPIIQVYTLQDLQIFHGHDT